MSAPEPGRILLPDAARGLAICGILICNAPAFAPGTPPEPSFLVAMLFQHRFVALFAMLFGASIVMVGGRRPAAKRDARLRRRFGWLAIFGIVHGALIWWGDILLAYAITGLLVMSCRSWPARRLIFIGTGGFALLAIASASMAPIPEAAAFAANGDHWWHVVRHDLPGDCLTLAPLMLLGMGLFKAGIMSGSAPAYVYRRLVLAGIGALLLAAIPSRFQGMTAWVSAPPLALGYIGLLALAARSRWAFIPRALAPAGRMALTNYLLQSLALTAFAGGVAPVMALAIVMAASQLVLSAVWLSRFDAGPVETLWRRLYRKPDRPSSLSLSPSWPRAPARPFSRRFHKDGTPT